MSSGQPGELHGLNGLSGIPTTSYQVIMTLAHPLLFRPHALSLGLAPAPGQQKDPAPLPGSINQFNNIKSQS
jgi:hypothetical protein